MRKAAWCGRPVEALAQVHRWRRQIESGQAKSSTDLEQESVTDAYVSRLLPLNCLAPNIVELDGGRAAVRWSHPEL